MTQPNPNQNKLEPIHGAFLIDKPVGPTSYAVVEQIQRAFMDRMQVRKREAPKVGHGGTLDPFATGLLVVFVGDAVKLSRYFLGGDKTYEGVFKFGETTLSGDPTTPITETNPHLPESVEEMQPRAHLLTVQPYLQVPPMHSAKKQNGRPLYELARQGIEVDREAKTCHLYQFELLDYQAPRLHVRIRCSSGTYIRTLAQDFAKMCGTVGLLENLRRTASGSLGVSTVRGLDETCNLIRAASSAQTLLEAPHFVEFNDLLKDLDPAQITLEDARALQQGKQNTLARILFRSGGYTRESQVRALYLGRELVGVARRDDASGEWSIDRVFLKH